MTKLISLLAGAALFTIPSCSPVTAAPATNPTPGASEDVEPGAPRHVRAVTTDSSDAERSPYRFRPRTREAHTATAVAAPPALSSLPRLVNRLSSCYAPELAEGSTAVGHGGGYGYGHQGQMRMGGAGGAKHPVAKSSGSVSYGAAYGAAAPATAAPMAPPPPARSAPKPEADASKRKRSVPAAAAAPAAEKERADDGSTWGAPVDASARARDERAPAEVADHPSEATPDGYHDWGASLYLSNDDTMSLSSAQRVIYAIERFLPLPQEHIRPHELLNYFTFDTSEPGASDDFAVRPSLAPVDDKPGIYSLGLSITGRLLGKDSRRNAALSLVVDRSGSMSDSGRMEYLKRGLRRMTSELKRGDLLNLVLFDHEVCTPLENFVVGRDDPKALERAIQLMEPRGSTDVHLGLVTGYRLADAAYQSDYSNRVLLVTDALANTGETNPEMMAMISRYYDSRRIRLSGVGVGRDFNDELLDRLTERGRGAYVFLGSEAEVDAVFGTRFVSLIETTANDVHFRLHLPPSLRMNVFYGEESSTVKEDVQAIHYSANTAQLLLSDVMARGGTLRPEDEFMLSIEYENPETGRKQTEEYAYSLAQATRDTANVRKGRLIMTFVDGLSRMAARPGSYPNVAGGWADEEGYAQCEAGQGELRHLASGFENDAEVSKVLGLWNTYCSRFQRPSHAVRRDIPGSRERDGWPGSR